MHTESDTRVMSTYHEGRTEYTEYRVIHDAAGLEALERDLADQSYIVFDMETVPLEPGVVVARTDKPIDVQLSSDGLVWIAPFELVADRLKKLFQGKRIGGQNLKYDLAVCYHNGVDLADCDWWDTLLYGRISDENGQHSLDALVKQYLGVSITKKNFWEIYTRYTDAPKKVRWEYAADDVFWTKRLLEYFWRPK